MKGDEAGKGLVLGPWWWCQPEEDARGSAPTARVLFCRSHSSAPPPPLCSLPLGLARQLNGGRLVAWCYYDTYNGRSGGWAAWLGVPSAT